VQVQAARVQVQAACAQPLVARARVPAVAVGPEAALVAPRVTELSA
jgi:hypothetical protein